MRIITICKPVGQYRGKSTVYTVRYREYHISALKLGQYHTYFAHFPQNATTVESCCYVLNYYDGVSIRRRRSGVGEVVYRRYSILINNRHHRWAEQFIKLRLKVSRTQTQSQLTTFLTSFYFAQYNQAELY